MNTQPSVLSLPTYHKPVDWKLLIFLLLFLNVKLVIKLAALIIIYFLQPDSRFSFQKKNSRLPLFYPAVILIAVINYFLYKGFFNANYTIAFIIGLSFWLACILAIHQVKLFIDKNDPSVIYNTLVVFFVINAIVCFGEILKISIETGAINPYQYQGQFQKYFISTGDYVKGITFDTSITNAALNAFGVIFFLFKRNMVMVLLCMCILLFAASNLTNIILLATFLFLFLFKTDRNQKSMLVVCFFLMLIFLTKISPQNINYLANFYKNLAPGKTIAITGTVKHTATDKKVDSSLNLQKQKKELAMLYLDSIRKIISKEKYPGSEFAATSKPGLPEPDINTKPYQRIDDTDAIREKLLVFISKNNLQKKYPVSLPGKIISFQQTLDFFQQHPIRIILGDGMGRFSSKLAFRATALNVAGRYPEKFAYLNPEFKKKHLSLYLYFFSKQDSVHSIVNTPNSVYDQLLSEYGIAGFFAFIFFYLGYFLKNVKQLTYGLPLLMLLLGFFFIDYWFEQLSIIILFELLLLLNSKERRAAHE